ncbi:hypothetical protein GCM10010912_17260 [Paenibacillus albidus]|uniref:Uncharacterized protein n=1 Tax=Paenibacillus albidus TaxID=2041023 RepID=A0A917C640_9BACL|nr:hypothetical protein [Paenibacillus albidus]GGF72620.1 hypothetical protein GCM10010912_17260 [Paenibacillus albidus]
MKDWVIFLTAIIQLITAATLLKKAQEDNKKGTKRSRGGKRK